MPDDLLSFAAGEPLSAPLPRPNRHGWRFSRWTTADGSDVPAVMPAENLTLKAVWQAKTPRTLTLLYIIDGEPETYPIEQTTLFENDFIVLPDLSAIPHLADYTLRAWTRAAATDLDAQLPQLMPDEDITLLAHLTQESRKGKPTPSPTIRSVRSPLRRARLRRLCRFRAPIPAHAKAIASSVGIWIRRAPFPCLTEWIMKA